MHVGIVGLGYVGLPLAVAFANEGHAVTGVDVDERKVEAINERRSYIEDVDDEELRAVEAELHATRSFSALRDVEVIVLCVPTPLSANREPDLGPLLAATEGVSRVVRAGHLVVLESTTYPGTTREEVSPLLERSGLRAGVDFNVAFSPERIDPGRTDHDVRSTPKVVGGLSPACSDRAAAFYEQVCDHVVRVSSPDVAELTKLLENIFRSVNIALVNELSILCDRMGINIWEVIDAAATKPYGFMRFEPGPGMGGHCLPVDPFYLAWRARQFDLSTEFIELAGKVNQQMPYYCVQRIERVLNDAGKPVRGSKVALVGVSYKAGVGDVRESPALKMIGLLQGLGAEVSFHDPHVDELADFGLRNSTLADTTRDADISVIVTAHPSIDFDAVFSSGDVLDLRGVAHKTGKSAVLL